MRQRRPRWAQVNAEIAAAAEMLHSFAASFQDGTLVQLAEEHRFSVVTSKCHIFGNGGATFIAILKESHLAIHTWPEFGVALIDLFSCSSLSRKSANAFVERLARETGGAVQRFQLRRR